MQKTQLIQELTTVSSRMESQTNGKGFVSCEEIRIWMEWIDNIKQQIGLEGIQSGEVTENGIQVCGSCHQNIGKWKKAINKNMISGLVKCFNFAIENNRQTFLLREIGVNHSEYSELNHLVSFGLLYKNGERKNGEYGIPRKTVSEFLKGERTVGKYYISDPTKKGTSEERTLSEERIFISEAPGIKELQEEFGDKITEFVWNENFE